MFFFPLILSTLSLSLSLSLSLHLKGVDRHLYGMHWLAKQSQERIPGYQIPDIFRDSMYTRMRTDVMNTSNCGNQVEKALNILIPNALQLFLSLSLSLSLSFQKNVLIRHALRLSLSVSLFLCLSLSHTHALSRSLSPVVCVFPCSLAHSSTHFFLSHFRRFVFSVLVLFVWAVLDLVISSVMILLV